MACFLTATASAGEPGARRDGQAARVELREHDRRGQDLPHSSRCYSGMFT